MKISDMMESKYLKQSDVTEETLVTITGLKKMNLARDDEPAEYRWTITFKEFPKPMVLNATNIKRAGKALGDDTEGWLGQQIVLYCDHDVEYAGNVVGGLRLRGVRRQARVGGQSSEDINRKFREAVDESDLPF